MVIFIFIVLGFFAFGYAGYKIAIWLFELLFTEPKKATYTFVDNSVNHYHHEHKNIHIIDERTHDDILNNLN